MIEDEKLRAEYKALADNPVLNEVIAELERSAMENILTADLGDNETRLHGSLEVRIIREIRDKIQSAIMAAAPQRRRV